MTSRSLLTVLGSTGLLLATATACMLFAVALSTQPDRDGGKSMGGAVIGLAFLGGLLLAYASALGNEGYAWVLGKSGTSPARWALVLAAVLSATVVAVLSAITRAEPPGQVPWALWPVRAWAHWVWLPGLLAGAALGLYPALREALPARAWQLPLALLAALSLLAGAGLLVQLATSMVEQQAAREEADRAFDARRDESMRQKVREADVQQDFLSLLPQSSRHEQPDIRELALAKLRSHPDLDGALVRVLRGPHAEEAFAFLESNDPIDARALAEPVREGIVNHAQALRDHVSRTHTLRPDDYQYPVLRILATVDRYAGHGVDYRPALKQLRDAFDAPRDYAQPTPKMNGQRAIDDWLRQH